MSDNINQVNLNDLEAAAERGDTRAQFELGRRYLYGEGVEETPEKAAFWMEQSAKQGDADAQFFWGYMHFQGKGVPTADLEIMEKWYRLSAEQGHAKSMYALGVMYAIIKEGDKNTEESYVWFSLAVRLAVNDEEKKEYQKMKEEIAEELGLDQIRAAERKADDWEKDKEFKIKNLEAATKSNDFEAQYRLGYMHLNGQGVKKSIEEAVRLIESSAKGGCAVAQNIVGRELFEAVKRIKLVAEQQGHDKLPDRQATSVRVIKEEYKKNSPSFRMLNDLGIMLLEGTDVADAEAVNKKEAEAIDFLTKAARDGDPYAQYNLASIYTEKKDLIIAYSWICLATRSKYPYTLSAKERIEQYLKEEGIDINKAKANAESLAQEVKDPNIRH